MNAKISHACTSSFAFSMPVIGFVLALGIGLVWGPTKETSGGKERQTEAPQSATTKQ